MCTGRTFFSARREPIQFIFIPTSGRRSQEQPGNSCERLLWGFLRSILRVQMNEGTCKKVKSTDEEGGKSICIL